MGVLLKDADVVLTPISQSARNEFYNTFSPSILQTGGSNISSTVFKTGSDGSVSIVVIDLLVAVLKLL